MKKLHLLAIIFAIVSTVSCKDEDFVAQLNTDLTENNFTFSHKGGEKSFTVDCNESWSINEIPEWIKVAIDGKNGKQIPSFEGSKTVTLSTTTNENHKSRKAEFIITSKSGKNFAINITQERKPELKGYWILSEGYANRNNSELAWYDISKEELSVKQFAEINGKELGDTGNDLKIYGSKMYCVVSGSGMGNENEEGTNYIEVINPKDGKSIKRIPFTNVNGEPAKPRKIIFEGGKGYITSYSNEVVKLDTLSLSLEEHGTLSGTFAESLCFNNGKLFICNSGQGNDNKISVVNPKNMKEERVIETANNPMDIVSAGDDELYFSTNFDQYRVYKLDASNDEIEEISEMKANDLTLMNGTLYSCFLNFKTYSGTSYQMNLSTKEVSETGWDLAGSGIRLMMEYHIGQIEGTELLYLTGMGDDIAIINPSTKEVQHTFKVKVANGSSVVAYFN